MPAEPVFWPAADEALARLEKDPRQQHLVDRLNRLLDRMEEDAFDPRLGTRTFVSPDFGGVNATPVRTGAWYVLWQRGKEVGTVEVIFIHPIEVGPPGAPEPLD